jgi:plasmid maintenance system antidote protein VapI
MAARKKPMMTELLRKAIAEGGESFKGLERKTGLTRQSLMKFARGEQSLHLDLADKLAAYFGIEVRRKVR